VRYLTSPKGRAGASAGMQIAGTCKPLMGTRWDEAWNKPVERWRRELGITPITSGPNSW